jgi:Fic family protein
MTSIVEHIGITPGMSPWSVQIAMLPARRPAPVDAVVKEKTKLRNEELARQNGRAILAHLTKHRLGLTVNDLVDFTGLQRQTVTRRLRSLEFEGKVEMVNIRSKRHFLIKEQLQ